MRDALLQWRAAPAAHPWPLAVGLGISGASLLLYWMRLRSMPSNVPWFPGPPLIGVFPQLFQRMLNRTLLELIDEWHRKFGKTLAFEVPGFSIVATIDPANIEHILKTRFDNYVKPPLFTTPVFDLLGKGIFNSDGEIWHMQRKTASRMFTKKQFETHIWAVIKENTGKVAEILDRTEGTFDAFNLLNRLTLDTIGQIGFSRDIGSLEDPSSPFLRSFDRVQQISVLRLYTSPHWRLLRWLGVGFEREMREHLDILNDYALSIVRDLRRKTEVGEDSSFIGLFFSDKLVREMKPAEQESFMRDMVLNFLIAGRDTTAQCLSWTLFELTQHPEVVEKVRDEVRAVCGEDPVAFEQIKGLQYIQAILFEALRLHPSVPFNGKVALEDDRFPDGTVIPAGCTVGFNMYAQGRCEARWGQDACDFRPERWLEMSSKPSAFAYTVFNAGPRECLGRKLAELEMVDFLATILRDFDFTLMVDPSTVTYDTQLTLGMASGLPLTVRRHARPERGATASRGGA